MSLQEKLAAQRQASAGRIPPEKRAIMERVTNEQRSPSVLGRARKVGDAAPTFSLVNHDGRTIAASDLTSRGPLVVSFFRGSW
jgi:3-dehydroquinate synthase class II